ncbi:hypothetical protein N7478_008044 [Penicillium angulare]|uniref:uncharacterized protein n=1 Tax=Penicillium angulare TaxID=116970 RepID=UPI00253F954A|nr:uncharacterized protein N7478_008044 [Penicillium angulare]KAJ5272919.1 hypothetical protein N7478_008044 [Penicillium angulare]
MNTSASNCYGRVYKSRKSRPCDFCRYRKVTCDMPHGPPCHRCANKGQPCTFEDEPGPRKRTKIVNWFSDLEAFQDADPWGHVLPDGVLGPGSEHVLEQDNDLNAEGMGFTICDQNSQFPINSPNSGSEVANKSVSTYSSPGMQMSPQPVSVLPFDSFPVPGSGPPRVHSLEDIPNAFSFYIGPTGVSDVHVLSNQPYDSENVSLPKVNGLRYRIVNSSVGDNNEHLSTTRTVFGITDHSLIDKAQPKLGYDGIEDAWVRLWGMVDTTAAWRMVQLFARYIDPYFPIISKNQIPSSPSEIKFMPLGLLTAMCATALPFMMYDETLYTLLLHPPQAEDLYQLCWLAVSQDLHAPSLATLQACLLLQQRLPSNMYLSDTAFAWTLMSTALSVAQTIGLHRDPEGWASVPTWERNVRRRLWWGIYIMEKWVAFTRGMPSHFHDDDYDVSGLTRNDFDDCLSSQCLNTKTHIRHLAVLTNILSDIQKAFYSVKATSKTSHNLTYSLEIARPMRTRLKEWRERLTVHLLPRFDPAIESAAAQRVDELDGNGSLYLCYIVTHVALLKALLRPLGQWPGIALNDPENMEVIFKTAKAIIKGALVCVKEFVEFVEKLTGAQWNSFWHSCEYTPCFVATML